MAAINSRTLPADPRRLMAAHEAASTFYRHHLTRPTGPDGPRRYLTGRGLGVLVDRERPWQIGYAPPAWNTLTRHLRSAGFTADELVAAGLSSRTRDDRLIDVFRDRIVFPIRDPGGHIVAFTGRASPTMGDDAPKYLNSPQTAIYAKGDLLFGVAEQRDRITAGWMPVLVEGPTDAIAIWLAHSGTGRDGAVALALCGTAFTKTQAAAMLGMPGATRGVVAALDADRAGHRALEHAHQMLHGPTTPGPLLAAEFEPGQDPAELLRLPSGQPALREILQRRDRSLLEAILDHQLDRLLTRFPRLLADVNGRCDAARALIPWVFEASSPQEASRLTDQIARRTGVDHGTIIMIGANRVEGSLDRTRRDLDQLDPPPRRPSRAAQAFTALRRVTATGRQEQRATGATTELAQRSTHDSGPRGYGRRP